MPIYRLKLKLGVSVDGLTRICTLKKGGQYACPHASFSRRATKKSSGVYGVTELMNADIYSK